jgi:hypothetical protein
MTAANHGKPWTAEAEADLLRFFNLGVGLPDLCLAVGRTPYAIVTRLQELGVLCLITKGRTAYYARVEADAWIGFKEVNELTKEYR